MEIDKIGENGKYGLTDDIVCQSLGMNTQRTRRRDRPRSSSRRSAKIVNNDETPHTELFTPKYKILINKNNLFHGLWQYKICMTSI